MFSFGRSVHSSFLTALSGGKARLEFWRPENREFWLASWRYISNLGQRGTWRTAYEWAKLLLSLDPNGDPYCIGLILDQLALRGGQAEHFLNLSKRSYPLWIGMWDRTPNVQASTALAEYKLKRPQAARSSLRKAISNFPWLFARLFQELNVVHIPKAIWGTKARKDRETFESEMYVTRAKDLWNNPEAISFLVEVTESLEDARGGPLRDEPITRNEARHVLLSDTPSLISLIPRSFTTMQTSAADPLPPSNNAPSYSTTSLASLREIFRSTSPLPQPRVATPASTATQNEVSDAQEYRGLQAFFSRLIPWLGMGEAQANRTDENHTSEDILAAIERSGEPLEIVEERSARLLELQQRLLQQQGHGAEATEPESAGNPLEGILTPEQSTPEQLEILTSHSEQFRLFQRAEAAHGNNEIYERFNTMLEHRELMESIRDGGIWNQGRASQVPATNVDPQTPAEPAEAPYDDERNQRWLAGVGMLQLRDFVAENGVDEGNWPEDVDNTPVIEYARRVLLEKTATMNFILDYVLQQGTSAQVRELVGRFMEEESRGSEG